MGWLLKWSTKGLLFFFFFKQLLYRSMVKGHIWKWKWVQGKSCQGNITDPKGPWRPGPCLPPQPLLISHFPLLSLWLWCQIPLSLAPCPTSGPSCTLVSLPGSLPFIHLSWLVSVGLSYSLCSISGSLLCCVLCIFVFVLFLFLLTERKQGPDFNIRQKWMEGLKHTGYGWLWECLCFHWIFTNLFLFFLSLL